MFFGKHLDRGSIEFGEGGGIVKLCEGVKEGSKVLEDDLDENGRVLRCKLAEETAEYRISWAALFGF